MEALVTLSLVSLVLFAVFEMLTGAMKVSRFSHDKDEEIAATLACMDRLVSEMREAVVMDFPTVADGLQSVVRFRKADPNLTTRFQEVTPPPLSAQVWDPLDNSLNLKVRYSVSNQRLVREIGPAGGSYELATPVASNIAALKVNQDFTGVFVLEISVLFQGQASTLRRGVVLSPCLE